MELYISENIRKNRRESNLSQEAFAERLGVSFQTVSKWESGTNEPDIATLKELSKLFGCSFDFLLNDDEGMPIEKEKPEVVVKEVPVIKETIIVHQNEAHVCARCGKDIPEDELVSEDVSTGYV